jgi:hypothetical protein
MEAIESDGVFTSGKYPDGMRHVLVLAEQKDNSGYKWTSGVVTGETGPHDETFEVRTSSQFVKADVSFFHKEDIKNPEHNDVVELNTE